MLIRPPGQQCLSSLSCPFAAPPPPHTHTPSVSPFHSCDRTAHIISHFLPHLQQCAVLFMSFVLVTIAWEFGTALLAWLTVYWSGRKALWLARLKVGIFCRGRAEGGVACMCGSRCTGQCERHCGWRM